MLPRYDFVFLFDVTDGNPNGDPDAGNLPRVDPETGQGLVTDVCLKRKIRNYVQTAHEADQDPDGKPKDGEPRYEIYVREKAVLNVQHERAYSALKLEAEKKKLPKKEEKAREVTAWMCQNFYDIRTFGAVMTTEINAGQVRGPMQFGFARSVEPVVSLEHAVTRCAVTNEKDLEKERTIGRKFTIPYGLYRVHGFFNPHLANQTGFDQTDLELFWTALAGMFELDRSAARGEMAPRELIAFRHESPLGNAPAHRLLERVTIEGPQDRAERDGTEWEPARSFGDFTVSVDEADLPDGVTIERPAGISVA